MEVKAAFVCGCRKGYFLSKKKKEVAAERPAAKPWVGQLVKILVHATDKGVILPLAACAVLVSIFWGMDGEGKAEVMKKLLDLLASGKIAGWVASVLLVVLWARHWTMIKRVHEKEIKRITDERNAAQARAIAAPVKSSEAK